MPKTNLGFSSLLRHQQFCGELCVIAGDSDLVHASAELSACYANLIQATGRDVTLKQSGYFGAIDRVNRDVDAVLVF